MPNHGQPKRGPRLLEGMTIAIEPMITAGHYSTKTLPDKWTVVTADGSLSAHFEHTVAILKDGPRILTISPAAARPASGLPGVIGLHGSRSLSQPLLRRHPGIGRGMLRLPQDHLRLIHQHPQVRVGPAAACTLRRRFTCDPAAVAAAISAAIDRIPDGGWAAPPARPARPAGPPGARVSTTSDGTRDALRQALINRSARSCSLPSVARRAARTASKARASSPASSSRRPRARSADSIRSASPACSSAPARTGRPRNHRSQGGSQAALTAATEPPAGAGVAAATAAANAERVGSFGHVDPSGSGVSKLALITARMVRHAPGGARRGSPDCRPPPRHVRCRGPGRWSR